MEPWSVRRSLLAVSVGVAAALSVPAAAQQRARHFDIPSQPLSAALLAFSQQSGEMVLTLPEITEGKRSRTVRGNLPVQAALDRLLSGTGLSARPNGQGGFLITRRSGGSTVRIARKAGSVASDRAVTLPDRERPAVADVIVVTAQRRAEDIQDVPISITALSAERLKASGVQDNRDLPLLTPGLRVDSVGAYIQPAIRGITTTLTSGPEANVATYLDGVYHPDTFAAIYDLPDVKQIEVLKGPQGTLFGRNATGGAILISTLSPNLADMTGKLDLGYASFDTVAANGFVSAPLVADRIAASLSLYYQNVRSGWKTNAFTGARKGAGVETALVRGKLRFVPWDGADFTLNGLYSRRDDQSSYRQSYWRGNHDLAGRNGVIVPGRPWTYASDVDTIHNSRVFDLSLRGHIDVGPGMLTTTTAYAHSWAHLFFDPEGTKNDGPFATTFSDYKSYSQEFIYATSQLGRFRAVAGLFFYHARSGVLPYYVSDNDFQIWLDDKGTSYASFGEGTYDVTDRLSITGGIRYSYEKRASWAARLFGAPPLTRPPLIRIGEKSWNSFTPRVSLLYKATADTNIYVTYSEGFKSGLFNTPGFQAKPVNPEKVKAYEIGAKSDALPGLNVNAAAFHYDYTGLQVPSLESVNSALTQRILNAASARIWGAELNLDMELTDELRLKAGGSWLDASYVSFPNASINVPVVELPSPGNAQCTEVVKPTAGLCNVLADVSGNRMIRAPKWSGSLTGTYERGFREGTLSLNGTLYYSSAVFQEFGNRVRQPAYTKLNASIGWRFPGGLHLRFWGRNLTGRAVLTSLIGTSSYDAVDYERPRELGFEASFGF